MDNRIEKQVEIEAPVARVWRALTDHREFGAWFRAALDAPFVLGETSRGRITYPGYEHMTWEATVVRMEPERHFAFTWPHAGAGGEPKADAPRTLVEFRLEPTPRGTRLTVVESGFERLPPEGRGKAMRENESGWEEQVGNIARYVGEHP